MAAEVPETGMVALSVGLGCAQILEPVLSFLEGSPARCPALDAAVLFVALTVVMAYLAGVVLVYLHVTPSAGTPVALQAAFRQFLVFLCALLLFVGCFLLLFLAAGGW